jgi:hypothetical protein
MRDDAIDVLSVERNGTIKLTEQVLEVVGHELSTDTPALLALSKDVVSGNTRVDQVHEHGDTRPIIRAQLRAVCMPVGWGLPDLVDALIPMDCVHMGYE